MLGHFVPEKYYDLAHFWQKARHNILKNYCAQYGLTFDHSVAEIYLIMPHDLGKYQMLRLFDLQLAKQVGIYKWELFINAM